MRYLLIAPAACLLMALATTDTRAASPRQDLQIVNNNYIINDNYNSNRNVGPNTRRGGYDCGYRSYYGPGYYPRRYESFSEAAARIRAEHSRHRRHYHPRSNYNSPPYYYGW